MRRSIALLLSLVLMITMAPVSGVYAAAGSSVSSRPDNQGSSAGAEYEEGQVLVLYKEGEVDTDAPRTSQEKKAAQGAPRARSFGSIMTEAEGSRAAAQDARNTLGQQADILSRSLGRSYTIEDTVVFDPIADGDDETVVSIVTSAGMDADELADKLSANENIAAAEPNYIFHSYGMPDWNDRYLKDAWQNGSKGINADKIWGDKTSGSSEEPVVIAVMDTGIDYEHEELEGRLWTEPEGFKLKGYHGMDFVDGDADPMDENGHGTHCAGIIAAQADNNAGTAGVAGASDKVQLMSARILDESGSGNLEDIVAAFNYLIRARKEGVNIKAVNCSFGASVSSEIFDAVIDKAGENGILTIAAAGNESANNDEIPSSPANCKSQYVISVAALDDNGSKASYTNYGCKTVDVAAPGSNILSSVSYYNYAPYLYDGRQLAATTQYYGEFGGALISDKTGSDGSTHQAVTPVSGTDYDGAKISGVDDFGSSVTVNDRVEGSSGRVSLELTDSDPFPIGNNKTSLRWKIDDASEGDTYVLYFPYEKMSSSYDDTYLSMVLRTHTDSDGGAGELEVGDVIAYVDKNGKLAYRTATDSDDYSLGMSLPVYEDWNSIWQASGTLGALFPRSEIRDVRNNMMSFADARDLATDEVTAGAPGKSHSDAESASPEDGTADSDSEEAGDAADTDGAQSAVTTDGEEEIAADEAEAAGQQAGEYAVEMPEGEQAMTGLASDSSAAEQSKAEAAADKSAAAAEEYTAAGESTAAGEASPAEEMSGYGIGLVYTAEAAGDVYIDISSIAISRAGVDETKFGKYDVYSGTSMATPVVTGAAALIAAMEPDFTADQIRDTIYQSTRSGYSDICSTGGAVDFAHYSKAAPKPVISDASVDHEEKTVTLVTAGCGASPDITARFNYGDRSVKIKAGDINSDKDGNITIRDNYGLIGSDVSFVITNDAGIEGQRTFYLVKGLAEYSELFKMDKESDEFDFFDWGKRSSDGEEVEIIADDEEASVFPGSAKYLKGCDDLILYDDTGIYTLTPDEDEGTAVIEAAGEPIAKGIARYADEAAADNELWAPDDQEAYDEKKERAAKDGEDPFDEDLSYYTIETVTDPVYLDNNVIELVRVDLRDRDAYLLMGLDLGREDGTWKIYYDSMAELGEKPAELDLGRLSDVTLAGYHSRVYLIGLSRTHRGEDDENLKSTYSCSLSGSGMRWEKSADLTDAVSGGKAICYGDSLYYFLGKNNEGELDHGIYGFDGTKWSKKGTLPPALFDGGSGEISLIDLLLGRLPDSSFPCAYGIDDKGIILAGTSFDGGGDTFRFDPESGRIEQLGYTLWGDVTDRAVDGTVADGRLIVQYDIKDGEKVQAKYIDVDPGYATVDVSISGKGSGTVTGGGSHPIGAKLDISVSPDKGSYLYEIHTRGLSRNINKKYGKSTKASRKAFTSTFTGKRDASITVHFGKVSTKVNIKKIKTVKVGKRRLKASTDGTISGVRWKSSNKKYAKVLKNGKIQFRKAGIGKTVKLTAISKENPKLKATIKVKIKRK